MLYDNTIVILASIQAIQTEQLYNIIIELYALTLSTPLVQKLRSEFLIKDQYAVVFFVSTNQTLCNDIKDYLEKLPASSKLIRAITMCSHEHEVEIFNFVQAQTQRFQIILLPFPLRHAYVRNFIYAEGVMNATFVKQDRENHDKYYPEEVKEIRNKFGEDII